MRREASNGSAVGSSSGISPIRVGPLPRDRLSGMHEPQATYPSGGSHLIGSDVQTISAASLRTTQTVPYDESVNKSRIIMRCH